MVFALLIAAILWNLATWWLGLPASSSHTMIGSIIGVGVANQLMNGHTGISGVDWEQVTKVFKALLISPLVGFVMAAHPLLRLQAPRPRSPPLQGPRRHRPAAVLHPRLLILTCGGVSYFHGSNDGQKGMGLIMLILVGTVPTAYALNHAVGAKDVQTFTAVSTQAAGTLSELRRPQRHPRRQPSPNSKHFVSTKKFSPRRHARPPARWSPTSATRPTPTARSASVPPAMQANIRNQMYLASERSASWPSHGPQDHRRRHQAARQLQAAYLDKSTKFIPTWVKVAVALALGLGTMVGWKRIVVTVGEKIGKTHLTYAQGAAAEITAMVTIGLADGYGLPVSTTHVLSSGVAGTMAANKSGLQSPPSATSPSPGSSPSPPPPCSPAVSTMLFNMIAQLTSFARLCHTTSSGARVDTLNPAPMSLKAKIEAVIYASEEPVTLAQLTGLLGEEGQAELDALAAQQHSLALEDEESDAAPNNGADSTAEPILDADALNAETIVPTELTATEIVLTELTVTESSPPISPNPRHRCHPERRRAQRTAAEGPRRLRASHRPRNPFRRRARSPRRQIHRRRHQTPRAHVSATTSAPSSTSSSPTTPPATAASRSAKSPAASASPPSPSTTTPSAASSNPSNRR